MCYLYKVDKTGSIPVTSIEHVRPAHIWGYGIMAIM